MQFKKANGAIVDYALSALYGAGGDADGDMIQTTLFRQSQINTIRKDGRILENAQFNRTHQLERAILADEFKKGIDSYATTIARSAFMLLKYSYSSILSLRY